MPGGGAGPISSSIGGGGDTTGGVGVLFGGLGCVGRRIYYFWSRYPYAVTVLCGGYFLTRSDVISVQVLKKPESSALQRVNTTRERRDLWRKIILSTTMANDVWYTAAVGYDFFYHRLRWRSCCWWLFDVTQLYGRRACATGDYFSFLADAQRFCVKFGGASVVV